MFIHFLQERLVTPGTESTAGEGRYVENTIYSQMNFSIIRKIF